MSPSPEHGQITRQELLDAALELFAERGFDGTSIEAVLARVDVSRGALYHHFASKTALFEAALEATEARIATAIVDAAGRATTPREALRAGAIAWLELADDGAAQRIALIDAPAVVGWERWREIDAQHAFGLLRGVVADLAPASGLPPATVEPLAHMLNAALLELALLISRADDRAAALADATATLDAVIDRLFPALPS